MSEEQQREPGFHQNGNFSADSLSVSMRAATNFNRYDLCETLLMVTC